MEKKGGVLIVFLFFFHTKKPLRALCLCVLKEQVPACAGIALGVRGLCGLCVYFVFFVLKLDSRLRGNDAGKWAQEWRNEGARVFIKHPPLLSAHYPE